MKKRSAKIFLQLSILMVAMLFVVPCSLKREYRQTFDIPLSEIPKSAQSIPTSGCSLMFLTSAPTNLSLKKKRVFPLLRWTTPVKAGQPQKQYFGALVGKYPRTTVPIYILHEQYLI